MHSRPLPDRHGGPACATLDLVAPLAHEATATRHTENAGYSMPGCSGAVSPLIGLYLRPGDVDRANPRSTPLTATTPLDITHCQDYFSSVTAKSVAGIAVPMWSGESRMICGFFVSGVPLWAGRTGSRKARRCSTGTATRSVPPTLIAVGERFVDRTGAHIMAKSKRASAHINQTSRFAFQKINPSGDLLFEIRPGVPAIDALEIASCYMAAARDLAAEFASVSVGENPDHAWGSFYLIELAKAILDSAIVAANKENHDG